MVAVAPCAYGAFKASPYAGVSHDSEDVRYNEFDPGSGSYNFSITCEANMDVVIVCKIESFKSNGVTQFCK